MPHNRAGGYDEENAMMRRTSMCRVPYEEEEINVYWYTMRRRSLCTHAL